MARTLRKAVTVPEETSRIAIGERLRLTRMALGLSQAEFCRGAELETNTYNQYEKGRNQIRLDMAIRLVRAYRITLDWIYLGDPSNIPSGIHDKIRALRKSGA